MPSNIYFWKKYINIYTMKYMYVCIHVVILFDCLWILYMYIHSQMQKEPTHIMGEYNLRTNKYSQNIQGHTQIHRRIHCVHIHMYVYILVTHVHWYISTHMYISSRNNNDNILAVVLPSPSLRYALAVFCILFAQLWLLPCEISFSIRGQEPVRSYVSTHTHMVGSKQETNQQ